MFDGVAVYVSRILCSIVQRAYVPPTEPPATFFFRAPPHNRPRSRENPRTFWKQFECVGYFVPGEIRGEISGNTMHVNEANIHVTTAADFLPRDREPLLRNLIRKLTVTMGRIVFLEFKNGN